MDVERKNPDYLSKRRHSTQANLETLLTILYSGTPDELPEVIASTRSSIHAYKKQLRQERRDNSAALPRATLLAYEVDFLRMESAYRKSKKILSGTTDNVRYDRIPAAKAALTTAVAETPPDEVNAERLVTALARDSWTFRLQRYCAGIIALGMILTSVSYAQDHDNKKIPGMAFGAVSIAPCYVLSRNYERSRRETLLTHGLLWNRYQTAKQ